MKNDEETEKLIITRMTDVLWDSEIETELLKINELEENMALKKWFIDKKTLHEIKYLANRAGTYHNYCENELDDVEARLNAKLNS